MNSEGIDVSEGKNMVSVMRPLGKVGVKPFVVYHTGSELKAVGLLGKPER